MSIFSGEGSKTNSNRPNKYIHISRSYVGILNILQKQLLLGRNQNEDTTPIITFNDCVSAFLIKCDLITLTN